METQKTISLPIQTWLLIENYMKESHKDMHAAVEILVRHGFIRVMALTRPTMDAAASERMVEQGLDVEYSKSTKGVLV